VTIHSSHLIFNIYDLTNTRSRIAVGNQHLLIRSLYLASNVDKVTFT